MAKTISVSLNGQVAHFAFTRIERDRLYGRKERQVVDQDGQPCMPAYLSGDGGALVPSGGMALLYVDDGFDIVERSELATVDDAGKPLTLVPSTLGTEQALSGPIDPQRVIDHVITHVYQLQAEILPPALSSGLDAGGIFESRFCYRDDYQDHALFILKNDVGVFALVGDPHGFAFVQKEVVATPAEEAEEAEEAGDDLDFNMI